MTNHPIPVVLTGASQNSIAAATALALAAHSPAALVLPGRSLTRIQPVLDAIAAIDPSITAKFVPLDLTDLSSIPGTCAEINRSIEKIDVLINGAGVMATPYSKTKDGVELQFATNHLGHFKLTEGLMGKLADGGRVVNISSNGFQMGGVRFEDVNFQVSLFDPREFSVTSWWESSKADDGMGSVGRQGVRRVGRLCAIQDRKCPLRRCVGSQAQGSWNQGLCPAAWMCVALLSSTGCSLTDTHLSVIPETSLSNHLTPELWGKAFATMKRMLGPDAPTTMPLQKTLSQGAATVLVAALDPSIEKESGGFLDDCKIRPVEEGFAKGVENEDKLWRLSEKLSGEKWDL